MCLGSLLFHSGKLGNGAFDLAELGSELLIELLREMLKNLFSRVLEDRLDLFRMLRDHLVRFAADFLLLRGQHRVHLAASLVDCISRGILQLRLCYFGLCPFLCETNAKRLYAIPRFVDCFP